MRVFATSSRQLASTGILASVLPLIALSMLGCAVNASRLNAQMTAAEVEEAFEGWVEIGMPERDFDRSMDRLKLNTVWRNDDGTRTATARVLPKGVFWAGRRLETDNITAELRFPFEDTLLVSATYIRSWPDSDKEESTELNLKEASPQ